MYEFFHQISEKTLDIVDAIKYDVLAFPLPEVSLPSTIRINIGVNKDESHYFITFPEYPGLLTEGNNTQELWENMNDAVLTYFDVPRAVATRMPNIYDLPLPNGEKIVQKRNKRLAHA